MGGDLLWSGWARPGQKCMAFAPPTNILGEKRQIFKKFLSASIMLYHTRHVCACNKIGADIDWNNFGSMYVVPIKRFNKSVPFDSCYKTKVIIIHLTQNSIFSFYQ